MGSIIRQPTNQLDNPQNTLLYGDHNTLTEPATFDRGHSGDARTPQCLLTPVISSVLGHTNQPTIILFYKRLSLDRGYCTPVQSWKGCRYLSLALEPTPYTLRAHCGVLVKHKVGWLFLIGTPQRVRRIRGVDIKAKLRYHDRPPIHRWRTEQPTNQLSIISERIVVILF
jgi:hypothetical protein